ncbi:MAG: DUF4384 domain-containing protein [Candidatus Obscuribacterales bacterium]|nr:DUF4384 domain-containing protein [Candidatus Obscuribacterales bacterium]
MSSVLERTVFSILAVGLIVLPAVAADSKTKNLYLEQARKPDKPLNTGVKYWIELERDGKTSKVSHRTAFKKDDRIRFHVIPNMDGFAYIVMLQGSNGDNSVLFPAKGASENKIHANKEIVIPTEGANLKFDDKAGLETLRLVFSRKDLDPDSQLKPTSGTAVMLAAKPGKKSFVPNGYSVDITTAKNESKEPATKSLTLETAEGRAAEGGEVIVVSDAPNRPLNVDIALMHE